MKKSLILSVWAFLVAVVLLMAYSSVVLTPISIALRNFAVGIMGVAALASLAAFYMRLWEEHPWIRVIVFITLFFALDLTLIWTASILH
jgi:hypothetical protein